ncbi:Cofilin-1 [Manis javanica]|nr:Cofilin-1 [Manis javanica]
MQPMRPRKARRKTWNLSSGPWSLAPLKSKMIYATIEKQLTGIKHKLQANSFEVEDGCSLAEKLGDNAIISWEARLCGPPPAPCLEYLSALDLLVDGAGWPFLTLPEGLGNPSRGRAIPSPSCQTVPPTPLPGTSFFLHV